MFSRANLFNIPLQPTVAHDGQGEILTARVSDSNAVQSACNFIDYTEMPPGTAIGVHTHRNTEEEYYLVLSGAGQMRCGGETFEVSAGDLIRNPAGGEHGLVNTGDEPLRLFVFEVGVVT